ncbi:MAG: bifunctional tetrahydrofolate synthase/dihydrofolate synthase [Thiotrichales bacterium]|nr:MAG: bifunctional tetrahydrofolate synthase/dihydrofolate synthase [Thiotrichales bacterium]
MRFNTLAEWLSWQESLNPKEIDLGLERVSRVLKRAGFDDHFDCPLITVAGTNGKGSVVAYLEAMAQADGYRTCSYTSPHLLRYNERIRINGAEIDDSDLCEAFERIDQARDGVGLTYFEFGTLAAIDLFRAARPDLVIMEIGLGGRLDAVNILQPSVAVITSIAIDHTDWLGSDRETIAREKAGIIKPGCAAVCGDADPPQALLDRAANTGVALKRIGEHFGAETGGDQWCFYADSHRIDALPVPALAGEFQLSNAATAIMALRSLAGFRISHDAIRRGLVEVRLPGRFQLIRQNPDVILDVAHNSQAAAALQAQLASRPCRARTHAVIAMLADKPVADVIALLSSEIDVWYTSGLESVPRGLSAGDMAAAVEQQVTDGKLIAVSTVAEACEKAMAAADQNDRIIIFGSFYTVAEAMQFYTLQLH